MIIVEYKEEENHWTLWWKRLEVGALLVLKQPRMVGSPEADSPAKEERSDSPQLESSRDLLYLEIPSGLLGRAGLMLRGAGTGKVSGRAG